MKTNILNKALGNSTADNHGVIDKVEAQIDEIIKNNANLMLSIDQQIGDQNRAIAEANEKLDDIETLKDASVYHKYLAQRAEAQAAIRELTAKKEKLEESPMISAVEYNNAVDEIFAAFNSEKAATEAELYELSNKMSAAADRLEAMKVHADNVLFKLQDQAYKYDNRKIVDPSTGKKYSPTITIPTRCNPDFVIAWGHKPAATQPYQNYRAKLEKD